MLTDTDILPSHVFHCQATRTAIPTMWKCCCLKWRFGLDSWTPESSQHNIQLKVQLFYPHIFQQDFSEINTFQLTHGMCKLFTATLRQRGNTNYQYTNSHIGRLKSACIRCYIPGRCNLWNCYAFSQINRNRQKKNGQDYI